MKSYSKIALILTLVLIAAVAAGCNNVSEEEPEISEASVSESEVTEVTVTATPTPTPTEEEKVFIYCGFYFYEGDSTIQGKTGLETMSLSEAKKKYSDGSKLTTDDICELDYNVAYYMIEQGYSEDEINDELINYYFENEGTAGFLVGWALDDYNNGIRSYDEPKDPIVIYSATTEIEETSSSSSSGSSSSGSGSSSGSSSSGGESSGSSSSSGSGSGSSSSSSGSSSGSGTETTSAPAETTVVPNETTAAPTETTAAPAETATEPTISYYELTGSVTDSDGNEISVSFTGDSKSDVQSQYAAYCANQNVAPNNYNIWAVYSDGTKKKA